MDNFATILYMATLGHLVGDYLLQNNWMALHKKERASWALVSHCSLYSVAVTLAVFVATAGLYDWASYVWVWGIITMCHEIFDGTGIVDRWLHLIGGRSYANARAYIQKCENDEMKGYMLAYTALVQTVADNTLHLITNTAILYIFICVR